MVGRLLGASRQDADADLAEFRARYHDTPTPVESLYPGVVATLGDLRAAGVRLSVCSAKPQFLCEKVVSEVGLRDLFNAVVGSSPDRPCRPDPEHLVETLALLGGLRERVCLIGDSEVDHALAENAGVPLIMVAYGYAAQSFDKSHVALAATFSCIYDLTIAALARCNSPSAPRQSSAPT